MERGELVEQYIDEDPPELRRMHSCAQLPVWGPIEIPSAVMAQSRGEPGSISCDRRLGLGDFRYLVEQACQTHDLRATCSPQ